MVMRGGNGAEEIDHSYTDTVICPYCGHDNGGNAGDGPPTGEQQCYGCEKFFDCCPNYSVSYSTRKLDCRNGSPHRWNHDSWNNFGDKEWWHCRTCSKTELREPIAQQAIAKAKE